MEKSPRSRRRLSRALVPLAGKEMQVQKLSVHCIQLSTGEHVWAILSLASYSLSLLWENSECSV